MKKKEIKMGRKFEVKFEKKGRYLERNRIVLTGET